MASVESDGSRQTILPIGRPVLIRGAILALLLQLLTGCYHEQVDHRIQYARLSALPPTFAPPVHDESADDRLVITAMASAQSRDRFLGTTRSYAEERSDSGDSLTYRAAGPFNYEIETSPWTPSLALRYDLEDRLSFGIAYFANLFEGRYLQGGLVHADVVLPFPWLGLSLTAGVGVERYALRVEDSITSVSGPDFSRDDTLATQTFETFLEDRLAWMSVFGFSAVLKRGGQPLFIAPFVRGYSSGKAITFDRYPRSPAEVLGISHFTWEGGLRFPLPGRVRGSVGAGRTLLDLRDLEDPALWRSFVELERPL